MFQYEVFIMEKSKSALRVFEEILVKTYYYDQ